MAILTALTALLGVPSLRRWPPRVEDWLVKSDAVHASSAPSDFIFRPQDFGGDPSGLSDSTTAVQAALDAAFAINVPGQFHINGSNHAGATVHLGGGQFKISAPLYAGGKSGSDQRGGGARICCGALRADASMGSGFMLTLVPGQEDTTFDELMLDAAQVAGLGALHVDLGLRVTIRSVYVHGFSTFGIQVTKGHEVQVTDSFLGQYRWSESTPSHGKPLVATGTAISIEGQDDWIDNVIVFSAAIGIELKGGASILSNSHIYGDVNDQHGPALVVSGQSVRALGNYFDGKPVVLIDPMQVEVAHSFFLGAIAVELRSSGSAAAAINGLILNHNQFLVKAQTPVSVWLNETAGPFTEVRQARVLENIFEGPASGVATARRGTTVTLSLTLSANASEARFDLAGAFPFPCHRFSIGRVEHSLLTPITWHGFPRTAMRVGAGTEGCELLLESDTPLPEGTRVTVTAHSSVEE
jgi:hypothetical protein